MLAHLKHSKLNIAYTLHNPCDVSLFARLQMVVQLHAR